MENKTHLSAFSGSTMVASGELAIVLARLKKHLDAHPREMVLIFDDVTGCQVDFNMQGTIEEIIAQADRQLMRSDIEAPPSPAKGPGRPKLGVTSREVTLLPRHWEWLDHQPHGVSGTLRRLVEAARKSENDDGGSTRRIEAAGKFMWAIAGNLEHFEEASRALYAKKWDVLRGHIATWPEDIRTHIGQMLGV